MVPDSMMYMTIPADHMSTAESYGSSRNTCVPHAKQPGTGTGTRVVSCQRARRKGSSIFRVCGATSATPSPHPHIGYTHFRSVCCRRSDGCRLKGSVRFRGVNQARKRRGAKPVVTGQAHTRRAGAPVVIRVLVAQACCRGRYAGNGASPYLGGHVRRAASEAEFLLARFHDHREAKVGKLCTLLQGRAHVNMRAQAQTTLAAKTCSAGRLR